MATQEPTLVAKQLIQVSRTANEKKKLYLEQHKITEANRTQVNYADQENDLLSIRKPVLDEVNNLTSKQVIQVYAMAVFGRRLRAGGTGSLKQEVDDINFEIGQDHLKCLAPNRTRAQS